MKKLILSVAMSLMCCVSLNSHAETQGVVMGGDNRVQYFNYDPNAVYSINTHIGRAVLVQLGEGEYFDDEASALGMGDAESWSLAVKGNNIIFKPIKNQPETNIVLITNKRTYAFDLKNQEYAPPTYIARFTYPDEDSAVQSEAAVVSLPAAVKQVGVTADGLRIMIDAKYKTDYHFRGKKQLKPTNVWSDGRFTYIRYNHGADIPAVYRVMPDGSEMLVNSHIENDTIILQEVAQIYRLRLGKAVADIGVKTEIIPPFNTTGTSDDRYVRTDQ